MLVIFTDAETRPFNRAFLADSFRDSRIETIVIRIGSDRDRVYVDGAPDPLYVPEEGAAESAEIFAEATGGETFDEDELGQAIEAARRGAGRVGRKPSRRKSSRRRSPRMRLRPRSSPSRSSSGGEISDESAR